MDRASCIPLWPDCAECQPITHRRITIFTEQSLGPSGMGTADDLEEFRSCQTGYAGKAAPWNDLSRGAPLWKQGFRGFFLDTLVSYRLATNFDEKAQQDGLVRVIETLHQRYPGIRLILNRGFEIVPRVRDKVQMVAAESLLRGWDASLKRYVNVPEKDREWLLQQLQTIRERDRLPVLSIDYVAPHDRDATRETAHRIAQLGIIPWVSDAGLQTLGIGQVEAVARRVLILYNGADYPSINGASAHRFLEMPLNYMGYVADYADVREPLPEGVARDRYAGVVSWFGGAVPEMRAKSVRQQRG